MIVARAGMCASSAVLSVAVTPFFPENFTAPLGQVTMRCLRDGAVASNVLSEFLSIPPVVSLVVFAVLVFALVAVALVRMLPSPHGKFWIPMVLTEVGCCSQEGAATAPWNYYQNMKATPAGHEEQRRLYEAFLQVWDHSPGLLGVCWWEWTSAPGGPGDFNYTPRNKPAEQVLRRWFAEGKPASQPANASP